MKPFALIAVLALASGAVGFSPPTRTRQAEARRSTVTLDVKNANVREVLLSLKTQCGVKNMVIDPDVPASAATFYFRDVPCDSAFRIVFRTFGLASQPPLNSVLHVERERR